MWCGVVWCGVVWCGVVWCGVVWCGVVWCGLDWIGLDWDWDWVWVGLDWLIVVMIDYPLALENYKRALEIQIKVLGDQHPDVASSLNNIGNVYALTGSCWILV